MKKPLLLLSLFSTLSFAVLAQQTDKEKLKSYRKNPYWIAMMDDSTANYNEAKLAFEEFWKGKVRPEEEGYKTNEKIKKESAKRLVENDSDAKKYAFEHKRFENWLREKAPFVRLDDSIMTENEIQKLVQDELRRRNEDASKF